MIRLRQRGLALAQAARADAVLVGDQAGGQRDAPPPWPVALVLRLSVHAPVHKPQPWMRAPPAAPCRPRTHRRRPARPVPGLHRPQAERLHGLSDTAGMTSARRLLSAMSLALLAAAPLHAEVIEIRWSTEQRFEHRLTLAPGKFAELCGALAQGAEVRWAFEADAALDFNVHYHVGREVVYPERRAARPSAEGVLTAALAQDYCWMWTNRGAQPVRLDVRLAR